MMSGTHWLTVLALPLLFCACTQRGPAPASAGPHLILIVVDTLRSDHLGAYGYARPTSPHLDRLATEGVLFENAFSQSSWTAPSIASLFTSAYPSTHGVTTFRSVLPAGIPTLAELLREQGFLTIGLSANFVHIVERKGFARGFDSFAELRRQANPGEEDEFVGLVAADAPTVTTRAIEALDRAGDSRLFLYAHYMDPHSSYTPPEPFRSRFARPYEGPFTGSTEQLKLVAQGKLAMGAADARHLIDLYDAEIARVDTEIGRLFDAMRERQMFDESVIVVLSDHGEEFGENGGVFHGTTLYDEMTRVPLLVRLPNAQHAGRRVRDVVEVIDIGPTLTELLGVPDDRNSHGRSLASAIAGAVRDAYAGRAFSELHPDPQIDDALRPKQHRSALMDGDWAYLVAPDGSSQLLPQHDGNEVSPEQKKIAASTMAREHATAVRSARVGQAEQVPLSNKDREHLRALGYLP